jgi:hypothetical protein
MKKIFILIVCFCQTNSIYAMQRNINNRTANSTTHTLEDNSIEQHKKLLQNAKKRKSILIEQNNNNADFNDSNNDNEGDFTTLIHRPQKTKAAIKNNDAFSKFIRKENRKLKKANRILYQQDPNHPFFSPCEEDDFSESIGQSTFFIPGQANDEIINLKNNPISDEDESGSSSEGEVDEYDFQELQSLLHQLELDKYCDNVALESPLIREEDNRAEVLQEVLNNLPDLPDDIMDIVHDVMRSYNGETTEQN